MVESMHGAIRVLTTSRAYLSAVKYLSSAGECVGDRGTNRLHGARS